MTSDTSVVTSAVVQVIGSDTKTHNVTIQDAKQNLTLGANEKLSGIAAVFGNDTGSKKLTHDVANRTVYTF